MDLKHLAEPSIKWWLTQLFDYYHYYSYHLLFLAHKESFEVNMLPAMRFEAIVFAIHAFSGLGTVDGTRTVRGACEELTAVNTQGTGHWLTSLRSQE